MISTARSLPSHLSLQAIPMSSIGSTYSCNDGEVLGAWFVLAVPLSVVQPGGHLVILDVGAVTVVLLRVNFLPDPRHGVIPMTDPHIGKPVRVLSEALSDASPDLMRQLLQTIINALLPMPMPMPLWLVPSGVNPALTAPLNEAATSKPVSRSLTSPSRSRGLEGISLSGSSSVASGRRLR
jgi:hypothetical protein